MRTLIDFSKTPCIFEVTDEEFADYERRNAKEIERRELMRGHDEAQAIHNAELRGKQRANTRWQSVVTEKDAVIANKDAENEQLKQQLAELRSRLGEQ